MKILVLITDYPRPDGTHAYMFAHVRNRYYRKCGMDVTVINFASDRDYEMEGVRVITKSTYQREAKTYDILLSHASNLRNHYLFIKKYGDRFQRILFFFHGQEVLYLNESYPEPYPFIKKRKKIYKQFRQAYDFAKIHIWAAFYKKLAHKSAYIFVSQYILDMFKKNTHMSEADLLGNVHIIHNSIGEVFEYEHYDPDFPKDYDFITIRSNWDSSTYCIDLLVRIAQQNPESRFLLIGKGKYFQFQEVPHNLELIPRTMAHEEMLSYLNRARCALNLTRHDTQGVMTCELAAYGMPVITSDLGVCHEFFEQIPNVAMISNSDLADVAQISRQLQKKVPYPKDRTYFAENTIEKEVNLIRAMHNR